MAFSKREKVSLWSAIGIAVAILSLVAWTMFPVESQGTTTFTRQVEDSVLVSDDKVDQGEPQAPPMAEPEETNQVGRDVNPGTGDIQQEDVNEPSDVSIMQESELPAEPTETAYVLECSVPDSIKEGSSATMSAILFNTDLQPLADRTVAWSVSPGNYNFTSVTQADGTTELDADVSELEPGQYGVSAAYDTASCAETMLVTNHHGSHGPTPDTTKPVLAITAPVPGIDIAGPSSGVTAHVTGVSSDSQTGVSKVEVRWTAWWGLTGYRTAAPSNPDDWSSWSYDIKFNTDGPKSVLVKATDGAGNKSWKLTTFDVSFATDDTKPVISITEPLQASEFGGTGSVVVHVAGITSDLYSGIQLVEVRTDSAAYVTATPDVPGDWSSWQCDMSFATPGTHQITARATDGAGNTQWQTIDVVILPPDA